MKKFILLSTVCLFAVLLSCTNSLRMDERQVNFDAQYFSYSKYQLTTAIVQTAFAYGKGVIDANKGEADMYFILCYQADELHSFAEAENLWTADDGSNPYTSVFRTFKALEDLATSENNKANVAASKILKCVNMAFLTEKYGDVPFTDAAQGRTGVLFPKFDSQKAVYEGMFALLDDAIKILSDATSTGLPSDQDVLFHGDKTKWLKFANSLKFRLMMHSYNAFKAAGTDLSSKMQEIVSGGNFMSAVTDNAVLPFDASSPGYCWFTNTNYNLNTYTEFKPTKSLVDKLVAFDDPRLYVIFAPALTPLSASPTSTTENVTINGFSYKITHDPVTNYTVSTVPGYDDNGNPIDVAYTLDAKWFGAPKSSNINLIYNGVGLPGTNGSYDNRRLSGLSTLFTKLTDPRLVSTLMESSEMQFLLAEARQKGIITAGTVQSYYESGVKLSFSRWQITDGAKPADYFNSSSIVTDFSNYLAQPGVALDGSSADLDKIYLQKWFANLLTNQSEEFTEIRRTGKPSFAFAIPAKMGGSYPNRHIYPFDEANNNKANYTSAASAIGGDVVGTKLWIFK
ncbi:MAG: SusD/RagB family nutrient-binding outer membrane lipoprotein [Mariniphaga sp.]